MKSCHHLSFGRRSFFSSFSSSSYFSSFSSCYNLQYLFKNSNRSSSSSSSKRRKSTSTSVTSSNNNSNNNNRWIECDALVIGGGIAGASMAYNLSLQGSYVRCIEQEYSPGYHSTGRAAGLFSENYGNVAIQILTSASKSWFERPPKECSAPDQDPILTPCGLMSVAKSEAQHALLKARGPHHQEKKEGKNGLSSNFMKRKKEAIQVLSKKQASQIYPWLQWSKLAELSVWEPTATMLNVGLVYQCYIRGCKSRNITIECNEQATQIIKCNNGTWEITTNSGKCYRCRLVINAAGAWADHIATLAGLRPLQVKPLRRSIITFVPGWKDNAPFKSMDFISMLKDINFSLPYIHGIDEHGKQHWYIAAQGHSGLLFASPANTDLDPEPCDAQCDDWDVALCVDRIEEHTHYAITKIISKWAGHRCHSEDYNFILGSDPNDSSFIWTAALAGQGIQSCPAYSRVNTCLALNKPIPQDILDYGFNVQDVLPNRFHKITSPLT